MPRNKSEKKPKAKAKPQGQRVHEIIATVGGREIWRTPIITATNYG